MNQTRSSILFALPLAFALPVLARAQSYECAESLGTNCRIALNDSYYNNQNLNGLPGSTTSTVTVLPGACDPGDPIVDVDVSVELIHPYVGDLEILLTHPDGTAVSMMYRPGISEIEGNCPGDDLRVTFDDDDGVDAFNACEPTIPAISGAVLPFNPLSVFDGKVRNGVWTLTVRDHGSGQSGVLLGWTLALPCVADLPDVTIEATDGLVAETGADDVAIVTITRTGNTDDPLEVEYVVTGTAALNDFEGLPGTATIAAGDDSVAVEVTAVADDLAELDETIVVTLVAGVDYEIGARDSATIALTERSLPGATGRDGGGSSDRDAAVGVDRDSSVADAGADAGTEGGDDDGCGCRVAGGNRGSWLAAFGLASLLAAFVMRRRRADR